MITTQDKELLAKKGITEEQIVEQLACFKKGILAPDAEEQKAYLAAWDAYTNTDKTVVKFVPADVYKRQVFKSPICITLKIGRKNIVIDNKTAIASIAKFCADGLETVNSDQMNCLLYTSHN